MTGIFSTRGETLNNISVLRNFLIEFSSEVLNECDLSHLDVDNPESRFYKMREIYIYLMSLICNNQKFNYLGDLGNIENLKRGKQYLIKPPMDVFNKHYQYKLESNHIFYERVKYINEYCTKKFDTFYHHHINISKVATHEFQNGLDLYNYVINPYHFMDRNFIVSEFKKLVDIVNNALDIIHSNSQVQLMKVVS